MESIPGVLTQLGGPVADRLGMDHAITIGTRRTPTGAHRIYFAWLGRLVEIDVWGGGYGARGFAVWRIGQGRALVVSAST